MSLDATIGGSTTNSYLTVSEANSYFSDRAFASEWEDVDEQAQLLVTASKQLDWYVTWKGTRVGAIQSMDWPRNETYDKSGTLIPSDVIPQAVKEAVAELALSSMEGDRTADNPLGGLSLVQASTLKIVTEQGGATSTAPDVLPDKIWKILTGLTTKSGIGVVRLMRA